MNNDGNNPDQQRTYAGNQNSYKKNRTWIPEQIWDDKLEREEHVRNYKKSTSTHT
ncbi:MAG: hypothetical protein ABH827_04725 [bacterium]